jgi:hypothetical protein
MIKDPNSAISKELSLIIERSYNDLQRGASPLEALFSGVAQLREQVSPELPAFFDGITSRLRMAEHFPDLLIESLIFNDREKLLLGNAFLYPRNAKNAWIEWMQGSNPVSWTKSSAFQYLKAYLEKDGILWIVGESANAISEILKVIQAEVKKPSYTVFSNDTYESIKLNCKRGLLAPKKSQLILWVDESNSGESVISAIDENIGSIMPGSCDVMFQRIFILGQSWKLNPTGFIPLSFETLQLDQTISISIFKT